MMKTIWQSNGISEAARQLCQAAIGLIVLSGLAGCASIKPDTATVDDAHVTAAWVEMSGGNQAIARANTTLAQCPMISFDGTQTRMNLRAAAATISRRPTISAVADSKPSVFATATCEAPLPQHVTQITIGARALPVPRAEPQRIVILGDTGCRLKKTDRIFQDCNDEAAWPFPHVAEKAASFKPDLVLHVGDYHYRETTCPDNSEGCQGSAWGYGSDAWFADFLQPAAPLLAAAPWVFVRGNHEECARAGQGWFRYFDSRPYQPERSCDNSDNDHNANYSEPFAVNLGAHTQLIVFDSAKLGQIALSPTDPQYIKYLGQFQTVARLAAKPGVRSIFTSHHPAFGFVQYGHGGPVGFGAALQSVMRALYPDTYFPPEVELAIHGHVHNFQALNFSSNHPATFISGNGGDVVDPNFPVPFPADVTPAPGTTLESIAHTNTFGFMTMERDGADWIFKVYTRGGEKMAMCTMPAPGKIHCDKTDYIG
ncbi:Calcineurin-like phosphoesterase [Collimonas sp. OK307]|uniref:metallophosphoesterase n=1 Tax=Collimonas sp. OK307 TaxID=1801620 RepID=UPI0008EFD0B9|nr:metallophosphoesterase [Collimonas sp. OK307]SFI37740.1 Calcineurin-like phosphoesterase [Collimonas sp. OK307]